MSNEFFAIRQNRDYPSERAKARVEAAALRYARSCAYGVPESVVDDNRSFLLLHLVNHGLLTIDEAQRCSFDWSMPVNRETDESYYRVNVYVSALPGPVLTIDCAATA